MKYLVEFLCPPGHLNWIGALLIDYRQAGHDVCLVTYREYRDAIPGAENAAFISIGNRVPVGTSAITRKLHRSAGLFRSLRAVPGGDLQFLSYDPWIMQWLHFHRRTALVFEHNNLDRAEASPLYALAYRLMPRRLTHSCFEPYIAEHARVAFGKRTRVFPHSRRSLAPLSATRSAAVALHGAYCFAPTPCNELKVVVELAAYVQDLGLRLLTRAPPGMASHYRLSHPNIHILTDPIDYDALLLGSSMVAILNTYTYRVSAVFFEAISSGKPCIVRDSLFARQVVENYPREDLTIFTT